MVNKSSIQSKTLLRVTLTRDNIMTLIIMHFSPASYYFIHTGVTQIKIQFMLSIPFFYFNLMAVIFWLKSNGHPLPYSAPLNFCPHQEIIFSFHCIIWPHSLGYENAFLLHFSPYSCIRISLFQEYGEKGANGLIYSFIVFLYIFIHNHLSFSMLHK
jgi:hypothetical protein